MSKKKDKIGSSKVSQVKKNKELSGVEKAGGVSEVESVQKAGGVKGVGKAGDSKRRPTRTMTSQEREKLFGMIKEEAEKLFKDSGLPPEQREIIENAVKIAVDSSLIDEEGE
jgi:hypothetical protein